MILEKRVVYTVRAKYVGSGTWALSFDDWAGVTVPVADILQAEHAAREQIAATIGKPVDAFEVQVDLEFSGLVDA